MKSSLPGYNDSLIPEFYSTPTSFTVIIKNMNYSTTNMRGNTLDNMHVTTQESMQDNILSLIEFCSIPRTRNEMQEYLGLKNMEYFKKIFLSL